MPSLAKRILVALAIVLCVAGILLLAANIYVQSQLSQRRVEGELSRALHLPVRIARISISPWKGLRITGITAPQPSPRGTGNFAEADTFTARFQWLPLLKRRLVIDDVELKRPHLAWFQNDSGKWRLPEPAAQAVPQITRPEPAETVPSPAPVETPSAPEKPGRPVKKKPVQPIEVAIKTLRFTDGTFDFYDRSGKIVASFTGVQALSCSPTLAAVSGTATIARIAVRERVFVENVTTPFTYRPDALDLSDVSSTVAGGTLTGKFHIKLTEPGSPMSTEAKFENIDLGRLLTDAHLPGDRATGKLAGSVQLAGKADEEKSLKGKAAFTCDGGQIRNYEFFQSLAQMFGIEELARLDLRRATAESRVEKGRVFIDSAVLETPNLLLTATGSIKFNGKLDLDARLAVNELVTRQLPKFVENFSPGATEGMRQIDFDVGGTLEKPKSNLLERLLGKNLESQAMGLFQSLFGGKKQQPKEEKKPAGKPKTDGTKKTP